MKVIDNFKNQLAKIKNHKKAPDQKTPTPKSMLLQTYFTSLLCLVLSVTMFFGTSYAWFSSEVNNDGNEIYIGTLDVALIKENGEDDVNLAVTTNKLFDGAIRWEPGYTALETIYVVNEGDLAFKYELAFREATVKQMIEGRTTLSVEEVAKYFDIWVYDHAASNMAPNPTSYEDIKEQNGWVNKGSLDKLISANEVVLSGKMPTQVSTTNEKTHTYTIAMHMNESAISELMGHKISLTVKLVAYQAVDEADDFGKNDYDENINVAFDVAGLNKLSSGAEVTMSSDIKIESADERVTMNGGILDGNKKTITYSGENENGNSVGVLTTNGGTIRNVTISSNTNGRALYVTKLNSDLYVSNSVLSGAYSFNLNSSNIESAKYSLNFNDTVFKNWTSYNNVISSANFTDCTFEEVLKPYGDTVLTNCSLKDGGLYIKELENGEKITLINCKYGNKEIKDLTITRAGTEYKFSAMGEEFVIDTTSDTTETILRWKTT